ncbi:hypothetical protein QNH98_19120 [Myroides sp. mNGS23_01]|nr:hypothetical protein [Myroides sp. mNGS23_01]WHT39034.1 hypothetical protein QNH98_19120 [Myroides sp. mNGS23_01]
MKKSLVLFAFLFLLTGGAMLAHTPMQLTTDAVEKVLTQRNLTVIQSLLKNLVQVP